MEIDSDSDPFRQAAPAVRLFLAAILLALFAATALAGHLLPLENGVPLRALLAIVGFLGISYVLLIPPVLVGKIKLSIYADADFEVLAPREKVEVICAYILRGLAILFIGLLFFAVAANVMAFLVELY